jgi:type II pantothenate kinase
VANLSGLKRIFFRGAYVCGHEKTMDKISRSLKYWSKGEVQTTFLCHEGFLGTLGAFWSYENMGIDSLAAHEVIREVLLGAPYTGQFPSLPVTEQQENGENNTLEGEIESLRNNNAALKAEVERLQSENAELRAKLRGATL